MSDFLSRLVGRSLGPSQAIQPRVPSLYEPYAKGSGPLWARRAFQGQDASSSSQSKDNVARGGSEDDNGRETGSRPMEESRHAPRSALVPAGSLAPAPPVLPSVAEVRASALESGSRPVVLTGRLQPREVATVGKNAPNNPAPAFSSTNPARSIPSNAIRTSSPVRPATRNSAASNSEDAGSPAVESRGAQLSSKSLIAEPAKANTATDSLIPSHMPAAIMEETAKPGMLTVPVATRPQRPEDPDVMSAAAVPYNLTAAEPSIRVSIGRVEVRAVFPTAPPRRAQPARPKPSLSLDDYLKQRNRGRQ